MAGLDQLRQTELAILNAPFEDRGWERAVGAIRESTRSTGAQLLGMGGPVLFPLNVFVGDIPGMENYLNDPRFHGPSNWRVGSTTQPMAIQYEAHYAEYRKQCDTSDYDDACSELDIPFGCQSALLLDSSNLLGLALLRSQRDGPCSADILHSFALLRRQLSRAVRVQLALDGEADEMMLGDFAQLHGATILLDLHGSVCAATPAADALIEADGPIRLEGLAVKLRSRGEDELFQAALARLLASDGYRDVVVHEMRIGRSIAHPGGAWRLFIVRLPKRDHGLGFDPHLAVTVQPVAISRRGRAAALPPL